MSDSKEKAKDILAGLASAGTIGAGIATMNPVLTATGALGFFANILNPSIRERINSYLELVRKDIQELEKKREEFKSENLIKNQRFVTAVLKTAEVSQKTHQEEKLELLKNVVINSVLDNSLEEDLQEVFVNSLDTITPSHVKALEKYSKLAVTKENSPEFQELEEKYHDFLSDLVTLGYLRFHDDSTGAVLISQAEYQPSYRITNKGAKFLKFIKKSDQKNPN